MGPKSRKNLNSKLSALVFDRDLGFSRGHQSDGKDEDEEEVKDDKDDNKEAEEDEENYQTIKCFTFSESQTQA